MDYNGNDICYFDTLVTMICSDYSDALVTMIFIYYFDALVINDIPFENQIRFSNFKKILELLNRIRNSRNAHMNSLSIF